MPCLWAFTFNKKKNQGQAIGLLLRFVSLLPEAQISPSHSRLSVISLCCSVAKSRSREGGLGNPSYHQ